ncbi:glutamine amidotransferase [Parasponia andersonii]|uniref:Glutamine amidotransferase n=1 Tax=Parasponia andersonii TaxID=3476 RepID=A0A2P5BAM8_PARAD|nr:glutamine amidotransferase [Parasponia andersonii]
MENLISPMEMSRNYLSREREAVFREITASEFLQNVVFLCNSRVRKSNPLWGVISRPRSVGSLNCKDSLIRGPAYGIGMGGGAPSSMVSGRELVETVMYVCVRDMGGAVYLSGARPFAFLWMQVTLSDVAVIAHTYTDSTGGACSTGEQPIKGAAMYDAANALSEAMMELGIAIDGGKDSLSMAAHAGGEEMMVCYFTFDLAKGKRRLGGSALAQVFDQAGDYCPDLDDVPYLKRVFYCTQVLLEDELISAGHDIIDGGLMTFALEVALAGNCGILFRLEFTWEEPLSNTLCRRTWSNYRDDKYVNATSKPKVAVIREEGSSGDREMVAAFYAAAFEPWDPTMSDLLNGSISLDDFGGVVFVGGFSYTDVLDTFSLGIDTWLVFDLVLHSNLDPTRYCEDDGSEMEQYPFNQNGSPLGIAALCSPDGRHLAMMPHPERCFLMWLYPWYPKRGSVEKKGPCPWLKVFQISETDVPESVPSGWSGSVSLLRMRLQKLSKEMTEFEATNSSTSNVHELVSSQQCCCCC